MRHTRRTVRCRGELFQFERLPAREAGDFVWAVTRRGEFIGTMPADPRETTKEFDTRSADWIAALLGS